MKKQIKKKSADAAPIGHVRRFLAIVNAIRAGDFPNKTSLAKDLKITTRTVQHYTTLLRSLGAPLEFDTDRNGFYFSKVWHL